MHSSRCSELSDEERGKIIELLSDPEIPISSIAVRFSCPQKTISRINKESGARPDSRKRRADNRFHYY